jgi:hypothetical protein
MSLRVNRGRRAVLRLGAALAVGAVASAVAAQDARSTAAQDAARGWLALTDRLDALASWEGAGQKFRNAMPVDRWSFALKQVRQPLGAVVQRTVGATRFAKSLKGFPEGDYAIVVFRTSFAEKTLAQETVTLDRTGGGWRVIGYSIA